MSDMEQVRDAFRFVGLAVRRSMAQREQVEVGRVVDEKNVDRLASRYKSGSYGGTHDEAELRRMIPDIGCHLPSGGRPREVDFEVARPMDIGFRDDHDLGAPEHPVKITRRGDRVRRKR